MKKINYHITNCIFIHIAKKFLFLTLLFVFITQWVNAQVFDTTLVQKVPKRKIVNVFVRMGHNFLGSQRSISSALDASGFGEVYAGRYGVGRREYPIVQERLELGLGFAAYLGSRSGLMVDVGFSDWVKILGYNTSYNSFDIESQLRTMIINYSYRLGSKHEITVGTMLYNYHVKATENNPASQLGAGFNIAHIYHIKSLKEPFRLAVKTEFYWVPEQEIGSYAIEGEAENVINEIPSFSTNLTGFSIGVMLGINVLNK